MSKTIRLLAAAFLLAVCSLPAAANNTADFEKAVELDRDSVIKRYNLGYAYYNDGNYDRAIDTLRQALDMKREDRESHAKVDANAAQILGIIFFNFKNNDDEAIKYFKRVIEINPADGDNYYFAGLSSLRKGREDDALAFFLDAVKNNTENRADANFRAGQIYYKKNLYGDAISWLEKAVKDKPKHVEAREMLGIIYHKRNDTEKAVSNLNEVVKTSPDNFNAHYLLGLNYYKQKEYDKMISAYKKAISINPNFADAYYNLGMAYSYRNMYEEAIAELETAKKLNPSDAATFSLLAQIKTNAFNYRLSQGTTYFADDKLLEARNEFELALKANQDSSEARRYLEKTNEAIRKAVPDKLAAASKAFDAKNYSEAYNNWNFAAQAEPGNSQARDGLRKIEDNLNALISAKEKTAASLEAEGNYDGALETYNEISPLAKGAKKEAVKEKIAALKTKQKNRVAAITASGDKLYAEKDYKNALKKYTDALKFDEKNSKALNGITKINAKIEEDKEKFIALASQNKGSDNEKAVLYYRKVINLDPGNEEANRNLEQLTGSRSKASINQKEIKTLYYEGVDRYVNGEIDKAIEIWERVLKIEPAHSEANNNIKRARAKLAAIKSLGK